MLKELPKLVGRGFAIGFFLPAAIWSASAVSVVGVPGAEGRLAWITSLSSLGDLAVASAGVWLVAILLMALNRPVYRIYEGYLRRPRWLHEWLEGRARSRYQELVKEHAELDIALERGALSASKRRRRAAVALALVQQFPEEEHILPTRFGNVLRAFETYPRVMYGLDDIPGWLRLTAVVPSEFKSSVDDQKALTDFWLNLRVALVLLTIQSVAMSLGGSVAWPVAVAAALLFLPLDMGLAWAARTAAIQWGEAVKATYDVFLPALADQMRLKVPDSPEAQREQWALLSRAVIYRDHESLPQRKSEPQPGEPADGDGS